MELSKKEIRKMANVTSKQPKAANPRPKTVDLKDELIAKLKSENMELKSKLEATNVDNSKPSVESHSPKSDEARDSKVERKSDRKSLRPVISSWLKENRVNLIVLAVAAAAMTRAFSEAYRD